MLTIISTDLSHTFKVSFDLGSFWLPWCTPTLVPFLHHWLMVWYLHFSHTSHSTVLLHSSLRPSTWWLNWGHSLSPSASLLAQNPSFLLGFLTDILHICHSSPFHLNQSLDPQPPLLLCLASRAMAVCGWLQSVCLYCPVFLTSSFCQT